MHVLAIPHPLQMAALMVAVIFLAGQVLLLVLAISSVGKPSHQRYKDLMRDWPYALVAPVVILKRRALPEGYSSYGGQHRSRVPQKSAGPDEGSTSAAVTAEQYRDALRLVMDQLSSVKMDRDLQELLMRQLESLEQRIRPADQE